MEEAKQPLLQEDEKVEEGEGQDRRHQRQQAVVSVKSSDEEEEDEDEDEEDEDEDDEDDDDEEDEESGSGSGGRRGRRRKQQAKRRRHRRRPRGPGFASRLLAAVVVRLQRLQLAKHLRVVQEVLSMPLMEALGMGALTLVAAMLSRPEAGVSALTMGLGVAAVVAAMIYGGARISGAHFNPAVTFSLMLLRKVTPFQALVYMGSQIGGAVGGAHLARALCSPELLADPTTHGVEGRNALLEIAFTFALAFSVIHTTLAPTQQPNSFAGFAICAIVACGASLGAVMNPALSTGLFVATDTGEGLWVRWLLPLLGALLAACLFLLTCVTENTILTPTSSEQELLYARIVGRVSRFLGAFVMELVGTFLLTLAVALALATPRGPPAPATAGLMLCALVYTGGYVSGGHYNPAVTLGVFLYRPRVKELPKAAAYVALQLVGALLAAGSVHSAYGHAACRDALPVPQGEHTWGQAVGAETTFTALLVLTVLLLAAAGAQGSQFFGVAIGAALAGGLYAAGSVSGGGLNPAVASALYVANAATDQIEHAWIYWVGPGFGALAAVLLVEVFSPLGGDLFSALSSSAAAAVTAAAAREESDGSVSSTNAAAGNDGADSSTTSSEAAAAAERRGRAKAKAHGGAGEQTGEAAVKSQ